MKTELTAIVEGGVLKLDTAVPLPDHTRVRLTIEPVESGNTSVAAWERVKERLRQRPIHGGGLRFTREELHERR
jgi:hypothetical protein